MAESVSNTTVAAFGLPGGTGWELPTEGFVVSLPPDDEEHEKTDRADNIRTTKLIDKRITCTKLK